MGGFVESVCGVDAGEPVGAVGAVAGGEQVGVVSDGDEADGVDGAPVGWVAVGGVVDAEFAAGEDGVADFGEGVGGWFVGCGGAAGEQVGVGVDEQAPGDVGGGVAVGFGECVDDFEHGGGECGAEAEGGGAAA